MVDEDSTQQGILDPFRNAWKELSSGLGTQWDRLNVWVGELGRLTQLVLGGIIAVGLGGIVTVVLEVVPTLGKYIPTFTTDTLLIVLIGVAVAQTFIQTRGLNRIRRKIDQTMVPQPRSDGGPPRDEEGRFKSPDEGTSGGGMIGGAIIGGAIGSSYGPGGTVAGAVIGAIIGDMAEEEASKEG